MKEMIPGSVIEAAQKEQAKWYVPSSVAIAQWALESDFGLHMPPGSNNPFGIKAKAGQASVSCLTHEEINGQMVPTTAAFAKYASLDEAFDAHGKLLATHPAYQPAMKARFNADNFANALTGVYATDTNYGEKLIALQKRFNLYAYNDLSKGQVMAPSTVPAPPVIPKTPGTQTAIWLNGIGMLLTALAGFTQYLPPQYAIAGVVITGLNGLLHQVTGNSGQPNPFTGA
jgi:hypothetical protein